MYGRSSLRFMLLLLIITLGIFLAVSIINNNGDNIRFNILGILWCVSVYVYCFFVEPIFYFRSFKKKYSENAVIRFVFDKKNLAVSINGENAAFDKRKGYCNIFKIIESDEYFFVYFKRDEAFIMKKSGLLKGNIKDISEILSIEMRNKFIRKVR